MQNARIVHWGTKLVRKVESLWLCFMLAPMFNDTVLAHFHHPHNAGDISDATATVEVTNPVCGDILRLSARMENGRIVSAGFKAQGCVAAIASGSVLTDMLAGKSLGEAQAITAQQISEGLDGLPPATFHAAQLCADAVAELIARLQ